MPQTVADALAAWNAAPAHIRMMGGQYVGPILAALSELAERVEKLEGGKNGKS